LASEGLRPKLPWATKLDTLIAVDLLEKAKHSLAYLITGLYFMKNNLKVFASLCNSKRYSNETLS